jgi:dsDNA-specific endonuclease/ATPase MutS2
LNANFAMAILDSIRKIPRLVIIFVRTHYIKRQLETWRRGEVVQEETELEKEEVKEKIAVYIWKCVYISKELNLSYDLV